MAKEYDGVSRMAVIDGHVGGRHLDDHATLADDALCTLWELIEVSADAPDAELPQMRNRWHDAIDAYRAERHRGGHRRQAERGNTIVADPDEPEMPDRLATAFGLTVA